MKIINTGDPQVKPSVVMMVYGEGGVGKTTFASTAPTPIIADCENGSKYFGMRGIKTDVALIDSWQDMNFENGFGSVAKSDKYETIIIDPIGELMDMLKRRMIALKDSKLVQKDGSPTMAGWGWLKSTMRDYLKVLKNSGKNVIFIAHIEEKQDEDRIVKRPKLETKLSDELIAMVDIVGYMTIVRDEEGDNKRVIIVDPSSDKYIAKDRTGRLGKYIEPDFTKIIEACQGTKEYSWSKTIEKEEDKKDETKGKPKETNEPLNPNNDVKAKLEQAKGEGDAK